MNRMKVENAEIYRKCRCPEALRGALPKHDLGIWKGKAQAGGHPRQNRRYKRLWFHRCSISMASGVAYHKTPVLSGVIILLTGG